MGHAPLRPVPSRPAGPVDPASAARAVTAALPALAPVEARALALVALAERPRPEVALQLGVSQDELAGALARARKELRRTVAVLGGSGWCERAERAISDRLDGSLAAAGAARLDVHLRNCPRCVEHERRLVQAADALLASAAPPPLPRAAPPGPLEEVPAPVEAAEDAAPVEEDAAPVEEDAAPVGVAATPIEGPAAPIEEPPAEEPPPVIEPPVVDPPVEPPPVEEPPVVDPPVVEGAASAEPVLAAEPAVAAEPASVAEPAAVAEGAPPPTRAQIAAAAEVLVGVRTRRQVAAALSWNALALLAVLLALATIALTLAGILGAEL